MIIIQMAYKLCNGTYEEYNVLLLLLYLYYTHDGT